MFIKIDILRIDKELIEAYKFYEYTKGIFKKQTIFGVEVFCTTGDSYIVESPYRGALDDAIIYLDNLFVVQH